MIMSETVKCVINGKPVKFTIAEELAYANDRWYAGVPETRWTELKVVKTGKGKYVLITYHVSMWQGEGSTAEYEVFDTLDKLIKSLDPTKSLDRKILEQLGRLEDLSEEI